MTNAGDKIAFMANVQCYGVDGRRLVPVHFTDNFVSLLPGEACDIGIEGAEDGCEIRVKAWNTLEKVLN